MNISDRLRFFLLVAGVIFLANLFLMNDVATLWNGPESQLLWEVMNGLSDTFPQMVIGLFSEAAPANLFSFRLPGVIFLCLSFGLYFILSRKIFGSTTGIMTLVVLGASFLIPNLAKRASADMMLFFAQILALVCLLRYLKKPGLVWQLLFYLGLFLSLVIHPLSSTILYILLPALLYFFHIQGKRLLPLGLGILILVSFTWFLTSSNSSLSAVRTIEFSWQTSSFGKYLAFSFLAFFPFIGFLFGGFRETIQKVRKGEELAIINLAIGIAALLAQSLLLQVLFAFLIAKQLQAYFIKNYPNQNIVKTGAILHLILVFGIAMVLMIGGFFEFKGPGFRAGLALGGLYWMLSLVSVIGLYGMNRRFVLGGAIMGGLLASTLFWLQAYPLWESKRNMQIQLSETIEKYDLNRSDLLVYERESAAFPNLAVYGKQHFLKVAVIRDSIALERENLSPNMIWNKSVKATLPENIQTDTIRGWNDRLRPVEYYFIPASDRTLIHDEQQNQED